MARDGARWREARPRERRLVLCCARFPLLARSRYCTRGRMLGSLPCRALESNRSRTRLPGSGCRWGLDGGWGAGGAGEGGGLGQQSFAGSPGLVMCECWALWASLVEWCDHVCELQLYSKAVGGGTRRRRTGVSWPVFVHGRAAVSRCGDVFLCRFDFPCHKVARAGSFMRYRWLYNIFHLF